MDEADAHKPEEFRSSKLKAGPITLYLTVTLSGCQRPTDLVICKLDFRQERGERASAKKKEEVR